MVVGYFGGHLLLSLADDFRPLRSAVIAALAITTSLIARRTGLWGIYWLPFASIVCGLVIAEERAEMFVILLAAVFVSGTVSPRLASMSERLIACSALTVIGSAFVVGPSTVLNHLATISFQTRVLGVFVAMGLILVLLWRQLVSPALWAIIPTSFALLSAETRWTSVFLFVAIVGMLRSIAQIASRRTLNASFVAATTAMFVLFLRRSSSEGLQLADAAAEGLADEIHTLTGRVYEIDRWFLVAIGMLLLVGYLWLVDVNGTRGPGPVLIRSFSVNGSTEKTESEQGLFRSTLGGIRLADPAEIPGASNVSVAALAVESTLTPTKLSSLLQAVVTRPSGYAVSIWVQGPDDLEDQGEHPEIDLTQEPDDTAADTDVVVQVQIADARSKKSLLSTEVRRATAESAVKAAAFVVGRFVWERCITRPAWYTWRQRDGKSLAEYSEAIRERDLFRERAIKKLERARALSPGNAVVRADLAVSYERSSRFIEALHLYTQVSTDYPRFLQASYRMGVGCNFVAKASSSAWNDYNKEPEELAKPATPEEEERHYEALRKFEGAKLNSLRRQEIVDLAYQRGLLDEELLQPAVRNMFGAWKDSVRADGPKTERPPDEAPERPAVPSLRSLLLLGKPDGPEWYLQKAVLHEISRLILEHHESRLIRPRIALWSLYQSERSVWLRLLLRPLELRRSRTVTRTSLLVTHASLLKTIHAAAAAHPEIWTYPSEDCTRGLTDAEESLNLLLEAPGVGWQAYYNAACFNSIVFDFYRSDSDSDVEIEGADTPKFRFSDRSLKRAFKFLNQALRQPDSALPRTLGSWSTTPATTPRNWWDIDPDLYPIRKLARNEFISWKTDLPLRRSESVARSLEAEATALDEAGATPTQP